MTIALTPRMKNWIEALGVHAVVADKKCFPTVLVTYNCKVEGAKIALPLTDAQIKQAAPSLESNPQVAIAPGQIGAVRAPYQFKGKGKIAGEALVIDVDEIYCTKPGAEAGLRLDTMGYEKMKDFDESHWKDLEPPQ